MPVTTTMWLTDAEWTTVALSLRVAALCAVLSLVPGIALAWLIARRRFPGRAVLDALVQLPLVLPPVVTGYVLLLLLGRRGPIGSWLGMDVAFTWVAAVLASAVVGFPLLVRAVRLSIEAIDRRIEDGATTLGAGPWRVFMTVTLPLALPGIVTGTLLTFARSLGEFGATITFAGNIPGQTQTIPLAIHSAAQTPGGDDAALRLVVLSIIVSFAAMLGAELIMQRWQRRRTS